MNIAYMPNKYYTFATDAKAAERRMIMPKTNADRIRAMSDEELAKMMTTPGGGFSCLKCLKTVEDECYMKCDEQCLEWLRQPAEGE